MSMQISTKDTTDQPSIQHDLYPSPESSPDRFRVVKVTRLTNLRPFADCLRDAAEIAN